MTVNSYPVLSLASVNQRSNACQQLGGTATGNTDVEHSKAKQVDRGGSPSSSMTSSPLTFAALQTTEIPSLPSINRRFSFAPSLPSTIPDFEAKQKSQSTPSQSTPSLLFQRHTSSSQLRVRQQEGNTRSSVSNQTRLRKPTRDYFPSASRNMGDMQTSNLKKLRKTITTSPASRYTFLNPTMSSSPNLSESGPSIAVGIRSHAFPEGTDEGKSVKESAPPAGASRDPKPPLLKRANATLGRTHSVSRSRVLPIQKDGNKHISQCRRSRSLCSISPQSSSRGSISSILHMNPSAQRPKRAHREPSVSTSGQPVRAAVLLLTPSKQKFSCFVVSDSFSLLTTATSIASHGDSEQQKSFAAFTSSSKRQKIQVRKIHPPICLQTTRSCLPQNHLQQRFPENSATATEKSSIDTKPAKGTLEAFQLDSPRSQKVPGVLAEDNQNLKCEVDGRAYKADVNERSTPFIDPEKFPVVLQNTETESQQNKVASIDSESTDIVYDHKDVNVIQSLTGVVERFKYETENFKKEVKNLTADIMEIVGNHSEKTKASFGVPKLPIRTLSDVESTPVFYNRVLNVIESVAIPKIEEFLATKMQKIVEEALGKSSKPKSASEEVFGECSSSSTAGVQRQPSVSQSESTSEIENILSTELECSMEKDVRNQITNLEIEKLQGRRNESVNDSLEIQNHRVLNELKNVNLKIEQLVEIVTQARSCQMTTQQQRQQQGSRPHPSTSSSNLSTPGRDRPASVPSTTFNSAANRTTMGGRRLGDKSGSRGGGASTPIMQQQFATPCSFALSNSLGLSDSRFTLMQSIMSCKNGTAKYDGIRCDDGMRKLDQSQTEDQDKYTEFHPTANDFELNREGMKATLFDEAKYQNLLSFSDGCGQQQPAPLGSDSPRRAGPSLAQCPCNRHSWYCDHGLDSDGPNGVSIGSLPGRYRGCSPLQSHHDTFLGNAPCLDRSSLDLSETEFISGESRSRSFLRLHSTCQAQSPTYRQRQARNAYENENSLVEDGKPASSLLTGIEGSTLGTIAEVDSSQGSEASALQKSRSAQDHQLPPNPKLFVPGNVGSNPDLRFRACHNSTAMDGNLVTAPDVVHSSDDNTTHCAIKPRPGPSIHDGNCNMLPKIDEMRNPDGCDLEDLENSSTKVLNESSSSCIVPIPIDTELPTVATSMSEESEKE